MKLPESIAENLVEILKSENLLSETLAQEVVESLAKDKNINWNQVLAKQYKSEEKLSDETED